MAFKKQDQVIRNPHIRNLEIRMHRTIEVGEPPQGIEFRLTIDDQFDRTMNYLNGDLMPHLSSGQINALIDFMDAMWAKAEDEVIG